VVVKVCPIIAYRRCAIFRAPLWIWRFKGGVPKFKNPWSRRPERLHNTHFPSQYILLWRKLKRNSRSAAKHSSTLNDTTTLHLRWVELLIIVSTCCFGGRRAVFVVASLGEKACFLFSSVVQP